MTMSHKADIVPTRSDLWSPGDGQAGPPSSLDFPTGPPAVDFTSLVGALDDLITIVQSWGGAMSPLLASLERPRIMLNPNEEDEPRGDGNAPRVAVLEHPAGLAGAVAGELRNWAALSALRVDIDPGYWLAPTTRATPIPGEAADVPVWSTRWNEPRRPILQQFPPPPVPSAVAGGFAVGTRRGPGRVLLIDTGDIGAERQDAFLVRRINVQDVPPHDWHGHGTSLGNLIRLRAPSVTVVAARVFEPRAPYSASPGLLSALTWAVNPVAAVDIVCIAQRAEVPDEHGDHAAVISSILDRSAANGVRMPVIVCAAGNVPRSRQRQPMALPATMPGVLVARAIGWDGRPLDYNCHPPYDSVVHIVDAFGGEEGDEIGMTEARDQNPVHMVGSSYAAALMAGALAAG